MEAVCRSAPVEGDGVAVGNVAGERQVIKHVVGDEMRNREAHRQQSEHEDADRTAPMAAKKTSARWNARLSSATPYVMSSTPGRFPNSACFAHDVVPVPRTVCQVPPAHLRGMRRLACYDVFGVPSKRNPAMVAAKMASARAACRARERHARNPPGKVSTASRLARADVSLRR